MNTRISLVLALAFTLALQSTLAQQATPSPTPSPQTTTPQPTPPLAVPSPSQVDASGEQDDDVVRITTNLVQIDAVVTDRDGRQVTDLRPEDFEILENDRPQPITNFSYVALTPGAQAVASPTRGRDDAGRSAPPVPPVRLRPEQVRRTYALVVDDLGLSFASVFFVRQAIKRFIDEQVQPGDLVAILRTGGGAGALQQFTADRRQLHAAIERVRWNPRGRGEVNTFRLLTGAPHTAENSGLGRGNQISEEANRRRDETTGERDEQVDEFREEIFSVGTLGALNFVVRGMRELPGRKAVVLFSDGFRMREARVREAVRRLTDVATRASVVFYTIDPRGLQVPEMLTAADNTFDLSSQQIDSMLNARSRAFFESQDGPVFLAQQTGGLAVYNANDIERGLRRVLADQAGYYLIGYRPDNATFNPTRRFNEVQIRLKRPGLRVRTRAGFYGVTDREARPAPRTRSEQLAAALYSPFTSGDVRLRLTSIFGNDAQTGSFVRSVMHLDARDLTFVSEADGWHRTVVDVVAITFGDNGRISDQVNRTETIRVRGAGYTAALQNGLVYPLSVPVRQPGAYQLRVAVRDSATARTGSANQFVEVPDLRRNHLTLSGLIALGTNRPPQTSAPSPSAAPSPSPQTTGGAVETPDVQASPAVRRFHTGMFLDYGYEIYNARLDRAARRPQLVTQARLFRDGQQVFAGQPQPFDTGAQTDMERLRAAGRILLGRELTPGEYILQVIVTDALISNERRRAATAWIDFEIIE